MSEMMRTGATRGGRRSVGLMVLAREGRIGQRGGKHPDCPTTTGEVGFGSAAGHLLVPCCILRTDTAEEATVHHTQTGGLCQDNSGLAIC